MMGTTFDEIRPYRGEDEVTSAIERIVADKTFYGFAQQMFAGKTLDEKFKQLEQVKTTKDFQKYIIKPLIEKLITNTSKGFVFEGMEHIEKGKAYLFVSNHRDIIMDSALLCYALLDKGRDTTEIAIGSNLLIHSWITDLVKLNRSFIVKRGDLGFKEQLASAKELSAYIYDTIVNRNVSIWIAQREGRTKDGYDQTQLSLLKMLNLSKGGNMAEVFKEITVVPLSISYEYEPCDGLKTHELYMKTKQEGYVKTQKDDMQSMFLGLSQQKGHIHFSLGKPITNDLLEQITEDESASGKILERLAKFIDRHIVTNFKLFANNYIAYDMLSKEPKYESYYNEQEKEAFTKHMNKKLALINGNTDLHKELFLKIYANPVLHKEEYSI